MKLAFLTNKNSNTLEGIKQELAALKKAVPGCSQKTENVDIFASEFPDAPTSDEGEYSRRYEFDTENAIVKI